MRTNPQNPKRKYYPEQIQILTLKQNSWTTEKTKEFFQFNKTLCQKSNTFKERK